MPEGDSIHRVAAKLRPHFEGRPLLDLECELAAADDWQLVGRTLARVEARGKNLLIHCAPLAAPTGKHGRPDPRVTEQLPVVIWTHLGMDGKWRICPTAAHRRGRSTLALHVEGQVASCTQPKVLRFLGPRGLARERSLRELGPDLLDPGADLDEAVARLLALGDQVALGDAIMRQSAVAGIGNVYKSELLFLAGLDPFAPVSSIDPIALRTVLERAQTLMRTNVEQGGPRRTRFDRRAPRKRLWVYERSGRPCPRCGTIVAMRRQGKLARSTYYCPSCQTSQDPRGR